MSTLCQALGASALRPAARAHAKNNRPFVAMTPSARDQFDATAHPTGFPPMPPPGVGGYVKGRASTSARPSVSAAAYANDHARAPQGDTRQIAQTAPPPTVEWDARNVNSVVVIGHVGADPEITEFGNGGCVARCAVAVGGKKKTASSGARMDGGFMDEDLQGQVSSGNDPSEDSETNWLDIEAWNDDARQLMEHVRKGRQIQVTGLLKKNSWTDKGTGQKRSRIKISADSIAFIAPYGGGSGGGGGGVGAPYAPYADPYGKPSPRFDDANSPASYGGAGENLAPAAFPHETPTSRFEDPGAVPMSETEYLWRDVLENPENWWDNRSRKNAPGGNPRYPDFKNKASQTPLWIESRETPRWAADALLAGGYGGNDGSLASQTARVQTPGGSEAFDPYEPDYSQPYAGASSDGYVPAERFPEEDEPPF